MLSRKYKIRKKSREDFLLVESMKYTYSYMCSANSQLKIFLQLEVKGKVSSASNIKEYGGVEL
jgi:hypothetical protein